MTPELSAAVTAALFMLIELSRVALDRNARRKGRKRTRWTDRTVSESRQAERHHSDMGGGC